MNGSPRGQWVAVGIIVTLLAGALGAGVLLSEDLVRVEVGGDAPSFTAVDLATNEPVSFDAYRGEVVLLNVWATSCAPCRVEMPSMERLYNTLGPEGLKVVAVSVDVGNPTSVRDFADEYGLSFDILQDRSMDITTTYQTTGLPESFIIDRSGVIVHWKIGAEQWDSPANVARLRRHLQEAG